MLGRVGIIVAARTSSTRLPGKALLPLQGVPTVIFLLRRLRGTKKADIVLATTALAADDKLAAVVVGEGVPVFRGADADVVSRYVGAAQQFGFDTVARVTADCPFVDAELVDWCIASAGAAGTFDLATTKGQFPVGLDVEIYSAARMAALDRSGQLDGADREHLTLYFYNRRDVCTIARIAPPASWPCTKRQFTFDTAEDYEAAKTLVAKMASADFSVKEMLEAMR